MLLYSVVVIDPLTNTATFLKISIYFLVVYFLSDEDEAELESQRLFSDETQCERTRSGGAGGEGVREGTRQNRHILNR